MNYNQSIYNQYIFIFEQCSNLELFFNLKVKFFKINFYILLINK